MMIDTHTHLYSEAFSEDRDEMMNRAQSAGIKFFFVPAIDASHTESMYQLKEKWPRHVHLMMGLHPTSVKDDYQSELEHVEKQFSQNKFVAVGEIGIDLYWDKTTLLFQQDAFLSQIKLAKKYKLPIVIHCREAFDEIFEILETEKGPDLFGIFHCFTGNFEQAQRAISFGLKLGIGGVITFKNGKIDTFLNKIPLSEIVLETDSPYLAPIPFRGKRNESSYLPLVCKKVAEIYGLTDDKIAEITSQNALKVFGLVEN